MRIEAGKIREARLALGGVAAKPWRAHAAEKILAGGSADAATFRRAAEAALAEAKPSGDNLFKIELAKRIIVRALRSQPQERRREFPPFPPPPSLPFPECSMTPEIRLAQAPAHGRHGSNIGQPLTRREGVLKVKGEARFAADNHPPGMLHAVLAVSQIARGRVTFLDVAAARRHPGVVEVMTSANRPALAEDPDAKTNPFMFRLDLLQNDQVRYANQPIAVVIAETLEAATEGAALLAPSYEALPARIGLDFSQPFVPRPSARQPLRDRRGDARGGSAAASKRIEATSRRRRIPQCDGAARHRGCLGRRQSVDRYAEPGPCHGAGPSRRNIRHLARQDPYPQPLPRRWLRLQGPDGKGPQVLGILAARLVGKPVKLVLRREQMYGPVGHRSASRQRLRIGLDGDGLLTAIDHHAKVATSSFGFYEPAADASHTLYASPAIATSHEAVRVDTGTPLFMRAPGEATGSIALESAIDEAAWACGMDPLAFRTQELRRGRTDFRQAVLLQGAPPMLRARRRALRLGHAPAQAAPDA